MISHDEKTQEVIAEIRNYQVAITQEQPIELFVDGLCENPGAMHIGLFARQGTTCLFTRHMFAGHGTCNEAEYIAVKTGLAILQALYPQPGVAVKVFSDSQLVTNQVNGLWKAGKMQEQCLHLRRFRKAYPFSLQKIPRSENEMADSLAQKYILKNSGRCMTLENGRFNVIKQVPPSVRRSDTYNAVTSQQFRIYLQNHNLHEDLAHLLLLASDGATDAAIDLARSVQQRAENVLAAAPRTNDLVSQWLDNTVGLIRQSLDILMTALREGQDLAEVHYIIEELSGAESSDSEIFTEQVVQLREQEGTGHMFDEGDTALA